MLAHVKGNHLEIRQQNILTQGTVGQTLALEFSKEWKNLTITAVFSAGSQARDVMVTANEITIPWELFVEADHKLYLNFHGSLPNGSIVLKTNIVSLGSIQSSRTPSGLESGAPSPSLVTQIQTAATEALSVAQSVRRVLQKGLPPHADHALGLVVRIGAEALAHAGGQHQCLHRSVLPNQSGV